MDGTDYSSDEIQCFQTTKQLPNLPPVIIHTYIKVTFDSMRSKMEGLCSRSSCFNEC